ncbi:hypothetical protein [Clostridium sp.]|uniref:hypothetical protein n=1 Tax=Clostridium sp. TaxID=1506 RepID=UPI002FC786E4
MDKSVEANKPTMNYINGILKNWVVQGYPKQWEGVKNGGSSSTKGNNARKSSEFVSKEYRDLTEEEWADLEAGLL